MDKQERKLIGDIFKEELDRLNVLCERDVYIDDYYSTVEEAVIRTVQRYLIRDHLKPVSK